MKIGRETRCGPWTPNRGECWTLSLSLSGETFESWRRRDALSFLAPRNMSRVSPFRVRSRRSDSTRARGKRRESDSLQLETVRRKRLPNLIPSKGLRTPKEGWMLERKSDRRRSKDLFKPWRMRKMKRGQPVFRAVKFTTSVFTLKCSTLKERFRTLKVTKGWDEIK